jgi:hypothetical protein
MKKNPDLSYVYIQNTNLLPDTQSTNSYLYYNGWNEQIVKKEYILSVLSTKYTERATKK